MQIGVILRDSNGIAQVRAITGSKILRVLKANGKQATTSGYMYLNMPCKAKTSIELPREGLRFCRTVSRQRPFV